MKIKHKSFFYVIAFIILFLLTAKISPLSDDWYYHTSPNTNPDITQLLPTQKFWRPFDVLFGFIMGTCPALFPYLNRACVILSHIISVYFMGKILHNLNMKNYAIGFCTLYAMFSSSVLATIVSPDGLNQSFCLLFGLIGLYSYIKGPEKLRYIIFCLISVLWKESGIVWICVIPFLSIMLHVKSIKEIFVNKSILTQVIKSIVIAFIFVAAYFGIRFALQGDISLGESNSRYSMSLFSFSAIKNFVNIFTNAMTGIDSIALFTASATNAVFIITTLLSLVFLGFIFYLFINVIQKKHNIVSLVSAIISAIIISLPHIAMGSAGEMHTYPTVFAVCIIYAYLLSKTSNINKKAFALSVICIFISFAISTTHKLVAIYDYSNRVQKLTDRMIEIYDNTEDELLVISVSEKEGYSVFTQSAIKGTDYGNSLKAYFGWKELPLHYVQVSNKEKSDIIAKEKILNYDKIWIVFNDEINIIK